MKEKRGVFIALEGIDGSGKSTQAKLLRDKLTEAGAFVHLTREPSGGEVGLLIRRVLSGEVKCSESAIALLFAADRAEHLLNGNNGVKALLDSGINVITDRCYLSSFAYQSVSLPLSWVMEINREATEGLKPDCHIFLDITPETAISRIHNRRKNGESEAELFENSKRLKSVREKYFELFELLENDENIIIVNGAHSAKEVSEIIFNKLGRLFL